MVMPQLEAQTQQQPSLHQAKTLISALSLVSRNLPLPDELLETVSSICCDAEEDSRDALGGYGAGRSEENGSVWILMFARF